MRQLFQGAITVGMTAAGERYSISNPTPGVFTTLAPGVTGEAPVQEAFPTFGEALEALRTRMAERNVTMTRKLLFVPADPAVLEQEIEMFDATVELTPENLVDLELLANMRDEIGLPEVRQLVNNVYWDGAANDAKFNQHHLVLSDKVQWASGNSSVDGEWEGATQPLSIQEVAEALNAEEREVFFCPPDNIAFICNSHLLAVADLPREIYEKEADSLSQLRAILDLMEARKEGRAARPRSGDEKVEMMMSGWRQADASYSRAGWRVIGSDREGRMFGLIHGEIVHVDPNRATYSPCRPDEVLDVETGLANGYIEFGVWQRYVSSRRQEQPLLVLYPATGYCVPWDFKFRLPE